MASRSTMQPSQQTSKSPFFRQRDALVGEIAVVRLSFLRTLIVIGKKNILTHPIVQGLENVLQNINKLNRSLEGVIAVGNEFGAVEALWSQFEGVMAQEPGQEGKEGESEGSGKEEDEIGSAEEVEKEEVKGRQR